MRGSTRGERRALPPRRIAAVVVSLLLALVLVPAVGVVTATPAAAAPITIGPIQADLSNHRGTDGSGSLSPATDNAGANCVRYPPASDTSSGNEVRVGHGQERVERAIFGWRYVKHQCPDQLGSARTWRDGLLSLIPYRTDGQSTIGFTPALATSATSGGAFLVGTLRYTNNPTQATATHFEGTLGLSLGAHADLDSAYVLQDTASSADTISFPGLSRTVGVRHEGIDYRLTVEGLTTLGAGATCGSPPTGGFAHQVSAPHGRVTTACLWARLDQVRPLTIVKQARALGDAPADMPPGFSVTAESDVATSSSFTLAPTAVTGPGSTASTSAGGILAGRERVVLTEGLLETATAWELSSIECLDGQEDPLASGVAVSLSAHRVVLTSLPEAASAEAAPVTCTFVSTYVAPTTLTLVSTTVPDGTTPVPDAGVPTTGWSYTVDALGAPLVTGADGTATGTIPVTGATRVVRVTQSVPAGYVFDAMTCRRNDGGAAPVTATGNPYDLTLERGRSHTCTALNLRPGVELVTEAFHADDAAFAAPLATAQQRPAGTPIVWRYTVRNTGQTELTDIRLSDASTATAADGAVTRRDATITCPGRPGIPAGTTVTIPSLAPGHEIACQSSGVL